MSYDRLDNEELLRLSLSAMTANRDAEATELLKTLVERDPSHAYGHYLLAAQHAQLGMMDRAEAGFRTATDLSPTDFPMPRFQLGQLLLLKGETSEARDTLAPLTEGSGSLSAYAAALSALAALDIPSAIQQLQQGLELPQAIPALAQDMARLLQQLREREPLVDQEEPAAVGAGASFLLSNYGRQH
jgi:Flp pilus assembly protein TadD